METKHTFKKELGLFDSTMLVVGSMIGSGIFIVSADIARTVSSPGWLIIAWVVTGLITLAAALLIYKPQYTWPGVGIVLLGIPVYFIWRKVSEKNYK
jgi:basic amino acid/polyamine antiporter, APA family